MSSATIQQHTPFSFNPPSDPQVQRVPLWNRRLQRKVAGNAAPMRKNLKKYLTPNFLEQHPDSFTNQGAAFAQSTTTSTYPTSYGWSAQYATSKFERSVCFDLAASHLSSVRFESPATHQTPPSPRHHCPRRYGSLHPPDLSPWTPRWLASTHAWPASNKSQPQSWSRSNP